MSGDPVDRYDVEYMIRDACVALRSEISNLADELRNAIGDERVDRQEADESLRRVLDARTERFA